jgi:hypothetical protein
MLKLIAVRLWTQRSTISNQAIKLLANWGSGFGLGSLFAPKPLLFLGLFNLNRYVRCNDHIIRRRLIDKSGVSQQWDGTHNKTAICTHFNNTSISTNKATSSHIASSKPNEQCVNLAVTDVRQPTNQPRQSQRPERITDSPWVQVYLAWPVAERVRRRVGCSCACVGCCLGAIDRTWSSPD